MPEEKKSFTESRLYPILFMIMVAAVFGLILSAFYHSTKDMVAMHAELRYKTAIISLFGLPDEDIEESYEKYVVEIEDENLFYYEARDEEGNHLGYGFPITGTGLWGSISALIAVNNELNTLIGLYILEQNETPGLGGRITEDKFQNQFSGKRIRENESVVQFNLIGESETADEYEVNQITGATSSSQAVVDMLYRSLQKIIEQME